MSSSLEERIAALEAIEAIKNLKHAYLRACDAKRPEEFRECFISKGAVLDYGPRMGRFEDADGIAEVFRAIALGQDDGRYRILDMHHAVHPVITVEGSDRASGQWSLRFRQADRKRSTETVSTIEYDDTYAVEDGSWRIASSTVTTLWTMTRPLPEGTVIHDTWSAATEQAVR
ncbi:nuclear transport factor 2 family protein [Nocardioides alcanivorans]|uniref:nuclear transport factor 2 family protein n=1 Tax=Nocardioides alcanivorans TaxID=2897352 RepID=UPI001F3C778B|nr:nuclear transport factor 2 family protein [Nocardioides alcanivorans]